MTIIGSFELKTNTAKGGFVVVEVVVVNEVAVVVVVNEVAVVVVVNEIAVVVKVFKAFVVIVVVEVVVVIGSLCRIKYIDKLPTNTPIEKDITTKSIHHFFMINFLLLSLEFAFFSLVDNSALAAYSSYTFPSSSSFSLLASDIKLILFRIDIILKCDFSQLKPLLKNRHLRPNDEYRLSFVNSY